MATSYDLIAEDFLSDLAALSNLVQAAHSSGSSAKARVASVNSATLLLAATFEEFVRQLGRQFARDVVSRTSDPKKLPKKLTATAWKRTLENLARAKIDTGGTPLSLEHISAESRAKFDSVWAFLGGDVSQDIYDSLIHNENNMRPSEINAVFSICDLSDVCLKICDHEKMKDHFGEEDKGKVHSRFLTSVNDFMEMRNDIAHSLNAGSSAGPEIFYSYVSTFQAVAVALAERLADSLPAEQAVG
ncbi:HEPN domain-containing protein [Neomegalonema perideroedes]|uniref:HEPN domain-containing protein n=1 Tax=Neomegalonema perideroedes TaxID=217219 RepID=UPI0012FD00EF|nr:HEPN domain-containing protein [Neomegalonema perideroedes]